MSVYDFQAASIDGTPIELSAYRGKVLPKIRDKFAPSIR